MRLLFVGDRPGYPERATGAAVSTYLLCGLLARNGAAVHHLCLRAKDGGVLRGSAGNAGTDPLVAVDRVEDPIAALPETIAAFRPDLAVLSAGENSAIARALAALGLPAVVYQRDLGMGPIRELRDRDALLGVFSCSDFIAGRVKEAFGIHSPTLPNIFPVDRYRVPATGDLVTFVSPVPAKGVDLVLELAARHRDLPFLFVEGWKMAPRQREAVQRRAAACGNIRWVGQLADMRPVYARTRVLLVPSVVLEASGRVATEALISGIPVLAADHGGLPQFVGPGGLLLPPGDVEAWSKGLAAVMSDRGLWADLSAKAAAHAARDFLNPNRIVAQFICQVRDWRRQPSLTSVKAAAGRGG